MRAGGFVRYEAREIEGRDLENAIRRLSRAAIGIVYDMRD